MSDLIRSLPGALAVATRVDWSLHSWCVGLPVSPLTVLAAVHHKATPGTSHERA